MRSSTVLIWAVAPLSVGAQKGQTGVKAPPADGVGAFGWIYDDTAGTIVTNCAAAETQRHAL